MMAIIVSNFILLLLWFMVQRPTRLVTLRYLRTKYYILCILVLRIIEIEFGIISALIRGDKTQNCVCIRFDKRSNAYIGLHQMNTMTMYRAHLRWAQNMEQRPLEVNGFSHSFIVYNNDNESFWQAIALTFSAERYRQNMHEKYRMIVPYGRRPVQRILEVCAVCCFCHANFQCHVTIQNMTFFGNQLHADTRARTHIGGR